MSFHSLHHLPQTCLLPLLQLLVPLRPWTIVARRAEAVLDLALANLILKLCVLVEDCALVRTRPCLLQAAPVPGPSPRADHALAAALAPARAVVALAALAAALKLPSSVAEGRMDAFCTKLLPPPLEPLGALGLITFVITLNSTE